MNTMKKSALFILSVLLFNACNSYDESGNYASYDYANQEQASTEKYKDYDENPFVSVAEQPVSTFSVDADGGAYANMRRFMNLGQTPPKAAVRVEEFINYFTFDYAEPVNDENISVNSEIAVCPWNTDHHLIRIGMKGKSIPENQLPNSNYVFLIDVSGSMSSPEKLELLKSGFKMMTDQLRDNDKVAIVTYAGNAAVLLAKITHHYKTNTYQQTKHHSFLYYFQ